MASSGTYEHIGVKLDGMVAEVEMREPTQGHHNGRPCIPRALPVGDVV